MDEQHLHDTLLRSATTQSPNSDEVPGTSSNSGIALRILLVISIGVISTWTNQASKGFLITVTNDIENTRAGKKFSLFYVSNDEVTRLVQTASGFATRILYPGLTGIPEKLINGVNIRLVNRNLTRDHVVVAGEKNNYILSLNPQIMELNDFRHIVRREIQRGMAEILLFELHNQAPKKVVEAMVDYISNLAGFGPKKRVFKLRGISGKCWEDENLAEFLRYCEEKSEGFIGRLNQAMRERNWDEETLNRALGSPATLLCQSFRSSMVKIQDSDFVYAYKCC